MSTETLPIPTPPFTDVLELLETYEYYDRPVLFSSRATDGTLYLAVLSAEDSTNTETWVLSPVSQADLQNVQTGNLELQQVFRDGVNNVAYIVTVDWNTKTSTSQQVKASELDVALLPESGVSVSG